MREFGSFLCWLFALTGSVLVLNLAMKALSLPVDIGIVAAILPLVVAFAILERGGGERMTRKILAYVAWFFSGFTVIVLTASMLALIQ